MLAHCTTEFWKELKEKCSLKGRHVQVFPFSQTVVQPGW
jgi:hypothetical protein